MRPNDLDALDDVALTDRVRGGETEAFGELWRRLSPAVVAAARSFTSYDAEDVAAEAFARVLRQLRAGGGPATEPRAYLIRAAGNVASELARRDAGATFDDIDGADLSPHATPDHADRVAQREAARAAYARLPERWRHALWVREVEDLSVQECARVLEMTPNSATVLLKRAREGFAQEWIRENIARTEGDHECGWVVARLPRYARGRSTATDAQRITRHLAQCRGCAVNDAEAKHLHERLALVLIPALLLLPGLHEFVALPRADAALASRGSLFSRRPRAVAAGALASVAGVAVAASVAVAAWSPTATGPGGIAEATTPTGTSSGATTDGALAQPTAPDDPGSPAPGSAEPDAMPRPSAAPGASPSAPSSPGSEASAPSRAFVERALAVDPITVTPGIFPTVTGVATSGASVTAQFSAGGRTSTVVVTASDTGAWSLSPSGSVSGVLSATFTQSYEATDGSTVTGAGPSGVAFTVEQLVEAAVLAETATSSTLMIAGPAGAAVEVSSPAVGLSRTLTIGASGIESVAVSAARSEVLGTRVRLISGSGVGPWFTT